MKLNTHTVWNTVVGALAVTGGVSSEPGQTQDAFAHAPARRLLQATAPVQASAQGPQLTVVPAQNGMPPMLALNGETTMLSGFNLYPPTSAMCGMPSTDFDAALDYMTHNGGSNTVRTWGFQSQNPAGDWSSLDHAVAATQQRGMALVVPMANQWGDCETLVDGMRQFKNSTWYQSGYKQVQPGDTISYRDYVQQLSARYGKYGHVHLQLLNEAVAGQLISPAGDDSDWICPDENAAAGILQTFVTDMLSVIRPNAPRTLVALGTRGESGDCGIGTDANFQAMAALTDVCEIHSYDDPAPTVARRLQSCQAAGRPTLMGESAASIQDGEELIPQDGGAPPESASLAALQGQVLMNRLGNYSTGGLSGMLFWHYVSPTGDTDGYALQQGHPLYSMLKSTDNAKLVASSAKYQQFAGLAQSLVPPSPPPPPPAAPPPPAGSLPAQDLTRPINYFTSAAPGVSPITASWQCAQDTQTRSMPLNFVGTATTDCFVVSSTQGSWAFECANYGSADVAQSTDLFPIPPCPEFPSKRK